MYSQTDIDISEKHRNYWTLFVYWSIRALIVIAAIFFAERGNWASAGSTILILLLMMVPSALKERYRFYLPFSLDLGISVFVFLTLFLGEVARFYERVPLWDIFLHIQSGFLLGAAGYVFLYILNEHQKLKLRLSPGFISLFAVAFSLSLEAIWEIVEFLGDMAFGTRMQLSGADTMWDIVANLLGALIISIPGYFWMHRHKRLPFTPWVLRILGAKRHDLTDDHTGFIEER